MSIEIRSGKDFGGPKLAGRNKYCRIQFGRGLAAQKTAPKSPEKFRKIHLRSKLHSPFFFFLSYLTALIESGVKICVGVCLEEEGWICVLGVAYVDVHYAKVADLQEMKGLFIKLFNVGNLVGGNVHSRRNVCFLN